MSFNPARYVALPSGETEIIALTLSNVTDVIQATIDHESEAFRSDWGVSSLIAALALIGTVDRRIEAVEAYIANSRSLLCKCVADDGISAAMRDACYEFLVGRRVEADEEPEAAAACAAEARAYPGALSATAATSRADTVPQVSGVPLTGLDAVVSNICAWSKSGLGSRVAAKVGPSA